jgi:hypothetical protein
MSKELDEEWQLDVVFGLLKAKVRNRLQREEIFSFDALLSRTRAIEAILSEGKKKVPENTGVQPQPKDNKKTRTDANTAITMGTPPTSVGSARGISHHMQQSHPK